MARTKWRGTVISVLGCLTACVPTRTLFRVLCFLVASPHECFTGFLVVKPTSPVRRLAVAGGVCGLPVTAAVRQENKSFPGFVSHTAPLRPDDRQNRQDGGNRFPKNLIIVLAVRAVRPLASLPEQTSLFPVLSRTLHLFRSRGCGACPFRPLEVRKPAFPATGHPTGKGKCFGQHPPWVHSFPV